MTRLPHEWRCTIAELLQKCPKESAMKVENLRMFNEKVSSIELGLAKCYARLLLTVVISIRNVHRRSAVIFCDVRSAVQSYC